MMSEQSLSEQLWNGLGDAITDIREKAVEEPWWGRSLSDNDAAPQWPQAQREQEQQPEGLSGEILAPEAQPMTTPENAPQLEHGFVLDNQSPSLQWPEPHETQPSLGSQMQSPEIEPQQDIDLDR
jgi:hypothetical protein